MVSEYLCMLIANGMHHFTFLYLPQGHIYSQGGARGARAPNQPESSIYTNHREMYLIIQLSTPSLPDLASVRLLAS